MIQLYALTAFICVSYLGVTGLRSSDIVESFDFDKSEPANSLGIFPTTMVYIHRPAKKITEVWKINNSFVDADIKDVIKYLCDVKTDYKQMGKWERCEFGEEEITAHVTRGVPEEKNVTTTFLSVNFKPFSRKGKEGKNEVCALSEVYVPTVYYVVKTYSQFPSNDSLPKTPEEAMAPAAVHQHQLSEFGWSMSEFFEDIIPDESLKYNFGQNEYYKRDPPYECFLNIGSGQSAAVIEEKCSFLCAQEVDSDEFEEYLEAAKESSYEHLEL